MLDPLAHLAAQAPLLVARRRPPEPPLRHRRAQPDHRLGRLRRLGALDPDLRPASRERRPARRRQPRGTGRRRRSRISSSCARSSSSPTPRPRSRRSRRSSTSASPISTRAIWSTSSTTAARSRRPRTSSRRARRRAVPVADLRRGAEANGHSWPTVERAKKLLGVQARRISAAGSPRGAGRWEWFLELDVARSRREVAYYARREFPRVVRELGSPARRASASPA